MFSAVFCINATVAFGNLDSGFNSAFQGIETLSVSVCKMLNNAYATKVISSKF